MTGMPWFLSSVALSLSLEPPFREEEMIGTEHTNKIEAATSAGDWFVTWGVDTVAIVPPWVSYRVSLK